MASARAQRRTVTVVFCDLAGSTALGEGVDPERLRILLARYFERMKTIVEHHGGTVEKFIGDAVMAVFGVPLAHEDDALRAVRAAEDMRSALPELGLEGRIGVMTGEVVTGTDERLATGDAVNVAARLEQAAAPGEVLLGRPTLRLVRDAVEVEAVEPLTLKGKAEPVAAYRLQRVLDVPERRHDAPFVGRGLELATVLDAARRSFAERRCELVTIVGEAGVGKTRLVSEALSAVEARVVRGRCLPYGEGITYWPVVEILKQLDVRPSDDAAAAAIDSLLGERDVSTSAEEIAWAFRKTLEHAASDGPLVVLLDDIQWGESTFHDLIEHVALLSSGAPLFLVCMARPELVEGRPTWPVALRLEPLGAEAVELLIDGRLDDELRAAIARAAGGNPLFISEMLAMSEETEGEVVVPPTLHALLAARLDQLEPHERAVLEVGSIEGEVFHRGAVQHLAASDLAVTPVLAALSRKQLIRPAGALLPGEDGFRFRHLLLRDAAHDAIPKTTRAELHASFATWLEAHGSELVELDELAGYHLEQAHRYRTELGLPDDLTIAAAARRHLTAAGQRAGNRADHRAAVSLLQRAVSLPSSGGLDVELEVHLADALFWSGSGEKALRRADGLAERAAAGGDRVSELRARILASSIRAYLEPTSRSESLEALVERALPVFQDAGDDVAVYDALSALGQSFNMQGRWDAGLEAFDRAGLHARRAGLPEELDERLAPWRAASRHYGTTPASKVLTRIEEQEHRQGSSDWTLAARASALAMLGHLGEARTILADVRERLADRGPSTFLGYLIGIVSAETEFEAGDSAAAIDYAEQGYALLEKLGERSMLASVSAMLAQAYYALDRLEDAESAARRASELAAPDDAWTQPRCLQVQAKLLARSGAYAEAEHLARDALAICAEASWLDGQANAHLDLAEVLLLAGKRDEAAAAVESALACFVGKGNRVSAERARTQLQALGGIAAPTP